MGRFLREGWCERSKILGAAQRHFYIFLDLGPVGNRRFGGFGRPRGSGDPPKRWGAKPPPFGWVFRPPGAAQTPKSTTPDRSKNPEKTKVSLSSAKDFGSKLAPGARPGDRPGLGACQSPNRHMGAGAHSKEKRDGERQPSSWRRQRLAIGHRDIHGPHFTWFGDIHGPEAYKFIWFGDSYGPNLIQHQTLNKYGVW